MRLRPRQMLFTCLTVQRRRALGQLSEHFDDRLQNLVHGNTAQLIRLPDAVPPAQDTQDSRTIVSPIFALITSRPHDLSTYLFSRGLIARPVVPPTVPPGSERVRICLRADMTFEILDRLIEAISGWVDRQPPHSAASSHISIMAKL